MKILSIDNLVFRLPVTFKGSLSDALRPRPPYHAGRPKQIKQKKHPGGRITRKTWNAFLDVVDKGGRLACLASIQQLTGKKWKVLKTK